MHNTAKDLLGDWYSQAVKTELNAPEIALRQASVSRLINNESTTFWFDSIRLFYGTLPEEHRTYQQYVTECRTDDSTFPVRNNQHVLRTIAGCTLAQKIESKRSDLTDAVCLALLTSNYLNRLGEYPLAELPERALSLWLKKCGSMRAINHELTYNPPSVELKTKKIDIPDIASTSYAGAETASVTAAMKKVQAHLTTLQADVQSFNGQDTKSVKPVLADIITRIDVLSEETNILWWLFSGFSRDLDQPFDEIGLPTMAVVAPKELAELTKVLPGLGHVKPHLLKAFRLAANEEYKTDQSIKSIIESVENVSTVSQSITTSVPDSCWDLLPCLFGLRCSHEYGESWAAVYQKKARIDPTKKVNIVNFAEQLYREYIFLRVFNQFD